jgi:hypothetical protein
MSPARCTNDTPCGLVPRTCVHRNNARHQASPMIYAQGVSDKQCALPTASEQAVVAGLLYFESSVPQQHRGWPAK